MSASTRYGSVLEPYRSDSDCKSHFRRSASRQAVGEILGSLDDKIELNRRMNETLEAMARTLFRSWFVDFDPVRAKADGRKPHGMDAATAKLFPDRFDTVVTGLRPEGWSTKSICDLVEGVYDGPHATPAKSNTGAVFLGIDNLTSSQLDLSNIRHISEADWRRWTRRVSPRTGDIVFSYEATLGYFALIPQGLRCCLGRRLALIRPSTAFPYPRYLFHAFIANPFQSMLMARRVHGSTVDLISLLDFPKYEVLLPPQGLIEKYEQFAAPLWELIHRSQSQSRTLAALRDTLLPQLLSGEVRVGAAGRIAEGMTYGDHTGPDRPLDAESLRTPTAGVQGGEDAVRQHQAVQILRGVGKRGRRHTPAGRNRQAAEASGRVGRRATTRWGWPRSCSRRSDSGWTSRRSPTRTGGWSSSTSRPAPRGTAYHLNGQYLMRSGEELVPMSEDRLRKIFGEGQPDWLEEPARGGVDAPASDRPARHPDILRLLERPYPTTQQAVLDHLRAERLIDKTDSTYLRPADGGDPARPPADRLPGDVPEGRPGGGLRRQVEGEDEARPDVGERATRWASGSSSRSS